MSILRTEKVIDEDKNGKDDEPDFHQVLKLELAKLNREYRILENKRHGFAQQDGNQRMLSNKLKPLLEKDRTELHHELRNATCRFHLRKANALAHEMKIALKTYDMYQEAIKKKIKLIQEIERHVDKITEKIIQQKIKMLALHGLSKTLPERERDQAKAENRLYHWTCACNAQIYENKKLRGEIVDLLMGRTSFFKSHNLLKKQIAQTKKKMLEIVQLTIYTYDTRDESMSKLKSLRERETKEMKQHGMDVQEFERTLHHDKKILGFIRTKIKHRPVFEEISERRFRLGASKEKELDTILRRYRRSFKRILAYSNTKSIADLVDAYYDLDHKNFNEFKYLTNLNSECEVLREAVEILKVKIEEAHAEVAERERAQRRVQERLQLSILAKEELFSAMEKQVLLNKEKVKRLLETVAEAFTLAECSTTPVLRLLGNKQGVTPNNVRLCIEQLDFRITEMKTERDRLQTIKSNGGNVASYKATVLTKSKIPSAGGPFFPKVLIGGMFNVETMEDDDSRIMETEPFYYEDMKEYIYHKMIEDRLVDPTQRSVSTIHMPSGDPDDRSSARVNNLMQKMQSHRTRDKRSPLSGDDEDSEDDGQGMEEGRSMVLNEEPKRPHHKHVKHIPNLGEKLQNLLSRDRDYEHPLHPQKGEDARYNLSAKTGVKSPRKTVRLAINDVPPSQFEEGEGQGVAKGSMAHFDEMSMAEDMFQTGFHGPQDGLRSSQHHRQRSSLHLPENDDDEPPRLSRTYSKHHTEN